MLGGFSVDHRIVYLYVWFVSMCLCCIRPNKRYVVVVVVAVAAAGGGGGGVKRFRHYS